MSWVELGIGFAAGIIVTIWAEYWAIEHFIGDFSTFIGNITGRNKNGK